MYVLFRRTRQGFFHGFDMTACVHQAVELIEHILCARAPALHELLVCELFRKIDLREMKGSCLPVSVHIVSSSVLSCEGLLNGVNKRKKE